MKSKKQLLLLSFIFYSNLFYNNAQGDVTLSLPLQSVQITKIETIIRSDGSLLKCGLLNGTFVPGLESSTIERFLEQRSKIDKLKRDLKRKKRYLPKSKLKKLKQNLTVLQKQNLLDIEFCNQISKENSQPDNNTNNNGQTSVDQNLEDQYSLDSIGQVTRNQQILLLERAAFGYGDIEKSWLELSEAADAKSYIDKIFETRPELPSLSETVNNLLDGSLNTFSTTHSASGQRQALMYQWTNSNNPAREKLALVLLSIWTVAGDVISDETFRSAFWDYYNLLRKHSYSTGNIEELAVEVTKDPLMLIYLNNSDNTKLAPNENYSRELQELFTIGTEDLDGNPNYTETALDGSGDIASAARALTGLVVKNNYSLKKLEVSYNAARHATGPHTIFSGKPYQFQAENYEDLVKGIIKNHPNVKYFYSQELLKEYLTPSPPRKLIESFAEVIKQNNYNLVDSLKVLFSLKAFYSSIYQDTLPKDSINFAVHAIKSLKLQNAYNHGEVDRQLVRLQMPVNLAPSVFWFDASGWTSSALAMERANFISQILGDTTSQKNASPPWSQQLLVPDLSLSPDQIVLQIADRLNLILTVDQQALLTKFLNTERQYTGVVIDKAFTGLTTEQKTDKALGLYYLLMGSMQKQLS